MSLETWKAYLNEVDYKFLINFVNNMENNIPNDKILILNGKSGTGKTTLINEIKNKIGTRNFHENSFIEGEFFFKQKKLGIHICGIHEYKNKKYLEIIKNIFESNISIIADTNCSENIHPEILNNSFVITMDHCFL